jgi:hypothetical protein
MLRFPLRFPAFSVQLPGRSNRTAAVGLVGGARASRKFGSTVATILGMWQSAVVQDVWDASHATRAARNKGWENIHEPVRVVGPLQITMWMRFRFACRYLYSPSIFTTKQATQVYCNNALAQVVHSDVTVSLFGYGQIDTKSMVQALSE